MTRVISEPMLDFSDVLIRPKRSTLASRSEVVLERSFTFRHSSVRYSGFPLIAANMDGVGTFTMADALGKHGASVALRKGYSVEQIEQFYSKRKKNYAHWLTIGITHSDINTLRRICSTTGVEYLCIDVANGYTENFVNAIRAIRSGEVLDRCDGELDPFGGVIMAGNVVTGDMAEALILAGADIVKVGIGPGSCCTTRKMTGVGYPQLSAVLECADAAHGLGGLICADGGCQCPGDVMKAYGAGADFVMLGGMLAGHDEGEYQTEDGKYVFYGMSSHEAQIRNGGEIKSYRASEGKAVSLEPRGSVENTLSEIMGGVRSGMTYIGAKSLKEVSKRTTFVQVNRQLNPMFNDN